MYYRPKKKCHRCYPYYYHCCYYYYHCCYPYPPKSQWSYYENGGNNSSQFLGSDQTGPFDDEM
ncbi:hypothetical protein [Metabacillus iocasae]|uniref:Spore coat protein n=1 Tax=Priestia iocasae TaxID=2291674 RepID=A0ABS2QTT8_9BACI|nr:hypothetical protein [Metabacillus iocasae]MBM7702342.1 hypothetical protein [Metabacillus iocasae]